MSSSAELPYPDVSEEYVQKIQNERFEIFKTQDLEKGYFDILHAHKFIIASASETMNAMLSARWTTTKDEPDKVETYSYDNFYEFLCFIYSGTCNLTHENVFQLVDMSEFYCVECLKKFCDKFLYDMEKTVENIEKMHEFAAKYSLPCLQSSIVLFICRGNGVFNAEKILSYKKPFIEFLSTFGRDRDYTIGRYNDALEIHESKFFESVYNWAEQQVMQRQSVNDESFNLLEAIKTELSTIIPNIKFSNMNIEFLMNFVVEKGFFLSSFKFANFFEMFRRHGGPSDNEEAIFKPVYELAEKQALKKKEMIDADESFSVLDSIKADLEKVIPAVKFDKMDKQFLMDFAVAKGIITEEQANHVDDTRVEIFNNGKTITGIFKDVHGIRKTVGSQDWYGKRGGNMKCRFLDLKFHIPKTPSTVAKMKGTDWYLCLEKDGILAIKHYSVVQMSDYLIAEMKG